MQMYSQRQVHTHTEHKAQSNNHIVHTNSEELIEFTIHRFVCIIQLPYQCGKNASTNQRSPHNSLKNPSRTIHILHTASHFTTTITVAHTLERLSVYRVFTTFDVHRTSTCMRCCVFSRKYDVLLAYTFGVGLSSIQ